MLNKLLICRRHLTACKIIFVSFLFFAIFLGGCGSGKSPIAPQKNTQVDKLFFDGADDEGNSVRLKEKPRRIVGLSSGVDEVIMTLVEPERIMAISFFTQNEELSPMAEEAKRYPGIKNRDPEAILRYKPDLVISYSSQSAPAELATTLKDMGIAVYISRVPRRVEDVFLRIERLGEVLGEKEKARKLVQTAKARLAILEEKIAKIPEEKRPVVLAFSNTKTVFGRKNDLFDDICRRAGVKNGAAMAGLVDNMQLSKEQVLAINPDIFLLPTWGKEGAEAEKASQEIINDPAYKDVKAVKTKRFAYVSDRYRYNNSHYIVEAIEEVAKSAYPNL